MSFRQLFAFTPLVRALKFACIVPGALLAHSAVAAVVETEFTVTDDTPLDYYSVNPGAILNVIGEGARTEEISAIFASVNINGGSVIAPTNIGSTPALRLVNSTATINNANITASKGTGLQLVREDDLASGSTAQVFASQIKGHAVGAWLTRYSELSLLGSQVTASAANGQGIRLFNGTVAATDSQISGGENGVFIADESAQAHSAGAVLTLNNSIVKGESGAAILVDGANAQINLGNASQLIGGNGNMLEVMQGGSAQLTVDSSALSGNILLKDNSSAQLTVDNSALSGNILLKDNSSAQLTLDRSELSGNILLNDNSSAQVNLSQSSLIGDVLAEAGADAKVTLANASQLTGNLNNVARLDINSGANWTLTGSNQVDALALSGGHVTFGAPGEFYRLDVNELSGNGTFHMTADFVTGEGDRLNVTGEAKGEHQLAISASGNEAAVERLTVVTTQGGDAQFSLLNGPVDLGAFSYGLVQEGNDWHLDAETKTISPGTRSVMALFNTAPTIWYGELSSLRTRMGELRYNEGKSGAWSRAYGSKYNVADASGTGYKQTQQGFTLGADAQVGDSQWLVGVLAGHSSSDLDLSRGTSGTVDSYYAGAYTTWLDQDSGYYFDAVAKVNRFDNKSKVAMSDGTQSKGNYKTNGVGASAEFGRHIKLDDGYFVEPFAQVAAVSIQGKSYDLDNGLKAEGDRTMSVLGKAGATVGRNFDLGEGRFAQPYLRAAAVHEFAKNNKVKVNDNVFNNDLSGSRAELGAGIAVSLSERLQVHADLDYSNGDKIEKPFGASVGVRFTW
ncbi:autotransporter outer membrane beta-barrel domain-containing protein [Pseudomonas sp. NPDC090755]|uniref:autotransporter outer membrane beta-barrel domain-containing protein n=1 Tax=Pseudomonas sp. NPDC090755 TaxID=3364481 RepID=UPI00383A6571